MDGAYTVDGIYLGSKKYKSARNGTLAWLRQTRPTEWEADHPCGKSICWALGCAGYHRYFAVTNVSTLPTHGWQARVGYAEGTVTIENGTASQIPNFLAVLPQRYTIAFWVCSGCLNALNASVSSIVAASYPGGNDTAAARNDCIAYNSDAQTLGMVLRFTPAGQIVGSDESGWKAAKRVDDGGWTFVVVTGKGGAPVGIDGVSTFWVGSKTVGPSILGSVSGVCSGGIIKSRPQTPGTVTRMYVW